MSLELALINILYLISRHLFVISSVDIIVRAECILYKQRLIYLHHRVTLRSAINIYVIGSESHLVIFYLSVVLINLESRHSAELSQVRAIKQQHLNVLNEIYLFILLLKTRCHGIVTVYYE